MLMFNLIMIFSKILRQEIGGSQAEQLESGPCRQVLQDKDNSRNKKELSPAWIEDEETHISHS